jgi:hypothetical protein
MGEVGGETDDDESDRERLLRVGEVVEFWEGVVIRGYRQAPRAPAFVKRVEGNGLYSIKMVGSNIEESIGWLGRRICLKREALQRMFVGQIAYE